MGRNRGQSERRQVDSPHQVEIDDDADDDGVFDDDHDVDDLDDYNGDDHTIDTINIIS